MTRWRFKSVFCSQCGRSFGPGNAGFSSCSQHAGMVEVDDAEGK